MADIVFQTVSELREEMGKIQRIMLFYGPSGSGKSRLAAQAPRPLILACDPGKMGGFPESALKFNPKLIKISSYQQILSLLPQLKEKAWVDFDTVVFDSISYFQRAVMSSILTMAGREVPRYDEFNLNAERLRKIIVLVAEIGCHIIYTATDSTQKDEIYGRVLGTPNLPGKLAVELPQACDIVMRFFTQASYGTDGKLTVNYKYRTIPDDMFYAKDRTGTLPSEGIIQKEDSFAIFRHLFQKEE